MMKRVSHQPAYVLHSRAYRETSALLEVWTQEHGRLTLLARGVKKNKSALAGVLQPFTPLLVSFVGRTELMTLTGAEMHQPAYVLARDCLFAGFYLNELLMALLERFDPHPPLFLAYEAALLALSGRELQVSVLREFEQILLAELGYGLFPTNLALLDQTFLPETSYLYFHEQGFVADTQQRLGAPPGNAFKGSDLLAIAQRDWSAAGVLKAAKRLTRLALQPLLGSREIHSRQLFLSPEEIAHA
jgi:DNA repair protein RecO (recombination protein O)